LCCFLFFVTIPAAMKRSTIILAGLFVLGVVAAAGYVGTRPGNTQAEQRAGQLLADGIERFEAKDHQGAIAILAQVPSETPQGAQARYYEGSAYLMLKDYESAAAKLEEARALKPDDMGTLYALGVVYYKLGNLALAKAYFAAVLEINPNDEQAKGLMDIMAKLERQSAPGADAEETSGD
jgi:tetratricopeptide (TPR) repeat protein